MSATTEAIDALGTALDGLLAALVALDAVQHVEVPADALDAALRVDTSYSDARREFVAVLDELRLVLGDEHRNLFFRVEETANAVASTASDVGFRVGFTMAAGTTP